MNRNSCLLVLLILSNFSVFSQSLKGVVSKTNIRSAAGNTEISDKVKKPKYYGYTYSNGVSLLKLISNEGTTIDTTFVGDEKLKDKGLETVYTYIKSHEENYYKNFNTNLYRLEVSKRNKNQINKNVSIKDTIPVYNWSLENLNQTIAGYNCKKATTIKTVGPRVINITAWYCEDLPISDGPMDYSGLPGMILQIEVEKNTIIKFEKLKYFKSENIEIVEPTNKTKMLTIQEYIKTR
ncbi:GLPGLI family protein [Algibacter sp. L3A6]|uniref:GLPGLI family protein n=1 Tax=Algibacter sp. L3A6 TaxID=2686366 RepID=UPI00131A8AE5|nr:GLPGLI family protein [Algibacter sp. L3A6]